MKRSETKSVSSQSRSQLRTAIAATIAIGAMGSAASAQNVWNGLGGDTRYLNPNNWAFGEPPTPADVGVLKNGGTVTIAEPGATAFQFRIGTTVGTGPNLGGTVNFEAGGEFITSPDNNAAGDVGVDAMEAGAVAVWNHNGGSFKTRELFRVGVGAAGVGTLNMSGGEITGQPITATNGTVTTPPTRLFLIGDAGTGTMNMTGGTINAVEVGFGWLNGSHATVNMSGGTINTTGETKFGFFGNSTSTITGGTINSHFDIRVQQFETGTSTVNMSAGTMKSDFNIVVAGATFDPPPTGTPPVDPPPRGAVATMNISGGTVTAGGAMRLSDSWLAHGAVNHSGGSVTVNEMIVGLWSDAEYALSNNGTVDVGGQLSVGTLQPRERDGGAGEQPRPVSTFTQSGNTSVTTAGLIIAEQATAVYTLSSGTLTVRGTPRNATGATGLPFAHFANMIVGHAGQTIIVDTNVPINFAGDGTYNQTGGTATIASNVFVGDLEESNGKFNISGGSFAVAKNFSIAGALASNAPADATRTGTQGQTPNGANGRLNVRGSASTITVGGNFLANPGDRTRGGTPGVATLAFDLDNSGITQINVAGNADLDGAQIDMGFLAGSTIVPAYNQAFNLITAQLFGATGTGTTQNTGTGQAFTSIGADAADWLLQIVSGGNGQILQAINKVVPGDTGTDKQVNFADLVVLAQNYNQTTAAGRTVGDFNRDGTVGFPDLVVLAQNYNANFSGQFELPAFASAAFASDWALAQSLAVPEPTTLGLLAGAGMLMVGRRRNASR